MSAPIFLGRLIKCGACNRMRLQADGPHAPHWRNGTLIDCVGTPLTLRDVTPGAES